MATDNSNNTTTSRSINLVKTVNPFGNLSYEERWTCEKIEEVVNLFDLDGHQKEQLLELKLRLLGLKEYWMNGPFELTRFVLEPTCHDNVKTMEKRFRKCIEWRQAEGLDTILETYSPPGYAYKFPGGILQDPDRNGDWVVVMRQGEPLELIKRYGKPEIIQALLWGNEFNFRGPWQIQHARRADGGNGGKRPTLGTAIIDLAGLAPRHYHPALLSIAANVAHPLQLHYPYMLKKVLVINAPRIFSWIWSTLIRHLVFEHLRQLIETASASGDESELLVDKYVDLQILPPALLSGKGNGKAVQPWIHPRWEIGPLPPPKSSGEAEEDWERPPLVYGPNTIWQQQQHQAKKQQSQDTSTLDTTSSTTTGKTTSTRSNSGVKKKQPSSLSKQQHASCGGTATTLFKGSWVITQTMDHGSSSNSTTTTTTTIQVW